VLSESVTLFRLFRGLNPSKHNKERRFSELVQERAEESGRKSRKWRVKREKGAQRKDVLMLAGDFFVAPRISNRGQF
jgi:hypothetical protein